MCVRSCDLEKKKIKGGGFCREEEKKRSKLCVEILGFNVYFVGILLMNYGLKLGLKCVILLEFY